MSKSLTLPAAPVSVQDSQDQDDLHIVEYLNQDNLPELLRLMLSQASTPAEQDMLLMSTLTAASAVLPNLYFRYGKTGKKYYANLQCFILAAAASGKGIAGQALEMLEPIQAMYPILIPGDSTFPAFFKRLYENGGRGYVHESEGTVITDIWKSQAATYSSILRKAAEHEMVSNNRVKEMKVIQNPQLSVLLTGTFSQYRHLVPSIENGYFSRLLPVIVRDTQPFNKSIVEADGHVEPISRQVGQQLGKLCMELYCGHEREWSLTAEQKARLASHVETEYKALTEMLGKNFHSAVVRMVIQIERIAMILSAMRRAKDYSGGKNSAEMHNIANDRPCMVDNSTGLGATAREDGKFDSPTNDKDRWLCTDEDYRTAEMIGGKLILHAAAAYKMIEGDKAELVPAIEMNCQKQMLFERLGAEFEHRALVEEAKAQGVSRNTALRWNDKWMANGLVKRIRQGVYQKVG